MTTKRAAFDFAVTLHGTIALLTPLTDAAREWASDHLPSERMTWGGSTVVEPRYLDDIIDGFTADGLTLNA